MSDKVLEPGALSSDEKRAYIEHVLRERVKQSTELPLSFAQQRLWFLERLEPGNPFYNLGAMVRLQGELKQEVLRRSLNEIVRRHEVLRTRFVAVKGAPVQVIGAAEPLRWTERDLSGLGAAEREREIKREAQTEAQRPFDLEAGGLLRVRLLRVSAAEQVLLITMHHLISDGWSVGVLIREVGALYEAYSQGAESPLEELPIQYADYTQWQREWLAGAELERQLGYWKQQLAGAPRVLELPGDRVRPAVQTYRGAMVSFGLGAELLAGLRELSRGAGVTLYMVLLAGFQVLLQRYTGERDIVVGTPIAGRNRAETEGLIGLFVNTLVLRTEVRGEARVRELLQGVKEVCLGAYAHQELPFERLVEELQPERSLSHNPLFQVMFVLQNAPQPALELEQLRIELAEVESGTAKFDLTLALTETEAGLRGQLEYSTELYDEATMKRLSGHYEQLLVSLVAEVDQRVGALAMVTPGEQRQLLEWSRGHGAYERAQSQSIHELFEAEVRRRTAAVAVVW